MIYTIIAIAAAVNAILAIIALIKGTNLLSVSFALLNLLLSGWAACVLFWQHYGHAEFEIINRMVTSLIPAAGMLFTCALFRLDNKKTVFYTAIIGVPAVILFGTAFMSLFNKSFESFEKSVLFQEFLMVYIFGALLVVFFVLIRNYMSIKFRLEKIKIGIVISAFLVLFTGGMLDLTGGLGLHKIQHAGIVSNMLYGVMIFFAIFRLRLLDTGIIIRNFVASVLVALMLALFYLITQYHFQNEWKAMAAMFVIISFAAVFFSSRIRNSFSEFLEERTGHPASGIAVKRISEAKSMQMDENEKLFYIQDVLEKYLETETVSYVKEGEYYTLLQPEKSGKFPLVLNSMSVPERVAVRYGISDETGKKFLLVLNADIAAPLRYGGYVTGILAGKKQTADISFTQDECDAFITAAAEASVLLNAMRLRKKIMEEENMKRLGMLARQMAHEIRNPLAALWGAVQLIMPDRAEDRENVGIVREEIRRLTGILDAWKDFSGDTKVERKLTDIRALAAECVKLSKLQPQASKVDFIFDGSGGPVYAMADPDKLKQVFFNLIINSVEAMDGKHSPEIKIEVIEKKESVEIKFRDNGRGINKANIEKVKEPLYTSKSKGSGLGLSVSERIVKAHGGLMIIDSDGETFTEVTVSIPS